MLLFLVLDVFYDCVIILLYKSMYLIYKIQIVLISRKADVGKRYDWRQLWDPDAASAQMTAMLFCEGSVRDKQIAQEW